MPLEQPGPGESFATKFTLVIEVVGEDVHGEGRHADVHLAADVALLRVGRVEAAVSLPVAGEVAAGGVVLTTLGAGVLWLALLDHNLLLLRSTVTCKKGLEIFRILENISTF